MTRQDRPPALVTGASSGIGREPAATAAKVLPETAKAKAQARLTEPGSADDA